MDKDIGTRTKRIWELDFIRGFCIILMIIDHALYDLGYIFHYQWFNGNESGLLYKLTEFARFYFPWDIRGYAWALVVFCFIFICGISCSFSRSNLKRGLRLGAVALLLTLVTWTLDRLMGQVDQFTIRFGILHMLSASILIYSFFRRLGTKFLLLIGILAIGLGIYFTYVPLEGGISYFAILAHYKGSFHSADYFPMLPWFGIFIMGASIGPIIYGNKLSFFPKLGKSVWIKPVLFTGRHSLVFYVVHQPIVYGLLYTIGLLAF